MIPQYRYFLSLAAAVLLAACSASTPVFNGTDVSSVSWGADFTLPAHTGKRVSTADFRGKVVVLYFGYIDCPDVCAPTLAKLASARTALGTDAEKLQVLFVTVDPRHDTAARLADFMPKFDASFVGLTGTAEEIAAVAREYKIAYRNNPPPAKPHAPGHAHASAMTDHSSAMLVKDVNGKLRLFLSAEASAADVAHDVRLLLKERAS